MSGWRPIAEYDRLMVKPPFAAFFFEAVLSARFGGFDLPPIVRTERTYGSRDCTHWVPLPDPPGFKPLRVVIPYGNARASNHLARGNGEDDRTLCGRPCYGWSINDAEVEEVIDSVYTCKRCRNEV